MTDEQKLPNNPSLLTVIKCMCPYCRNEVSLPIPAGEEVTLSRLTIESWDKHIADLTYELAIMERALELACGYEDPSIVCEGCIHDLTRHDCDAEVCKKRCIAHARTEMEEEHD